MKTPKIAAAAAADSVDPESYGIDMGGKRGDGSDAEQSTPQPREWHNIIDQTLEFIKRENPSAMKVAFGFRHFLYNKNSVRLAQRSKYCHNVDVDVDDPTFLGNSEDAYFSWLTNGGFAGESCLLLTSAGIVNEVRPVTDSQAWISAARRAHFLRIAQWKLPDGRNVVAWRRDSDSCRMT